MTYVLTHSFYDLTGLGHAVVRNLDPNNPIPLPHRLPEELCTGRDPSRPTRFHIPRRPPVRGARAEVLTEGEDSGPVERPYPGLAWRRAGCPVTSPHTPSRGLSTSPASPAGLKGPKCWLSGWGCLRPAHGGRGPERLPPHGPAPGFLTAPGSTKPSLFPLSMQRSFHCHPFRGHFPGWRHWPRSLWWPRH